MAIPATVLHYQPIVAADKANRLLAVNFQQRHRPEIEAAARGVASSRTESSERSGMPSSAPTSAFDLISPEMCS